MTVEEPDRIIEEPVVAKRTRARSLRWSTGTTATGFHFASRRAKRSAQEKA